jgi:hypothetical protein
MTKFEFLKRELPCGISSNARSAGKNSNIPVSYELSKLELIS